MQLSTYLSLKNKTQKDGLGTNGKFFLLFISPFNTKKGFPRGKFFFCSQKHCEVWIIKKTQSSLKKHCFFVLSFLPKTTKSLFLFCL
jgi:hypothetical protein